MAVLNKHKVGMPAGAIYIGRGSPWGNPFVIGEHGTRDEVCDKFKRHLWEEIKAGRVKLQDLADLKGKDLVCFCAPVRCHGHDLERAAAWAAKTLEGPWHDDVMPVVKAASSQHPEVKWSRIGGYQCSTRGDKRFSALCALMPDGRTIEQHYQCDVKGYQPGGYDWKLGKGKPPRNPVPDLYEAYLALWKVWAEHNPMLIKELRLRAAELGNYLSDCFAHTPVNQARALADILNSTQ